MESVPLASIMIEEVFRFQSITATITTFRITPFEHVVFTKAFHTISETCSIIREAPFSFLALEYGVYYHSLTQMRNLPSRQMMT